MLIKKLLFTRGCEYIDIHRLKHICLAFYFSLTCNGCHRLRRLHFRPAAVALPPFLPHPALRLDCCSPQVLHPLPGSHRTQVPRRPRLHRHHRQGRCRCGSAGQDPSYCPHSSCPGYPAASGNESLNRLRSGMVYWFGPCSLRGTLLGVICDLVHSASCRTPPTAGRSPGA